MNKKGHLRKIVIRKIKVTFEAEPRDRESDELIVKLDWGTSQKTSEQSAEQLNNWGIFDLNDVIILVPITAFVHPPKYINNNYGLLADYFSSKQHENLIYII